MGVAFPGRARLWAERLELEVGVGKPRCPAPSALLAQVPQVEAGLSRQGAPGNGTRGGHVCLVKPAVSLFQERTPAGKHTCDLLRRAESFLPTPHTQARRTIPPGSHTQCPPRVPGNRGTHPAQQVAGRS